MVRTSYVWITPAISQYWQAWYRAWIVFHVQLSVQVLEDKHHRSCRCIPSLPQAFNRDGWTYFLIQTLWHQLEDREFKFHLSMKKDRENIFSLSTVTCCCLIFNLQSTMIFRTFPVLLMTEQSHSSFNTNAFDNLIFLSYLWFIGLWTLCYWFEFFFFCILRWF